MALFLTQPDSNINLMDYQPQDNMKTIKRLFKIKAYLTLNKKKINYPKLLTCLSMIYKVQIIYYILRAAIYYMTLYKHVNKILEFICCDTMDTLLCDNMVILGYHCMVAIMCNFMDDY